MEELKLEKQIEQSFDVYMPTDKEKQVVEDALNLFRRTADARNQNFVYFDGLNLIDYIEDSVRRFNTNIDEREDIEPWQAAVNTGLTRNKVLAILGKIRAILPIAQFVGRGDEDVQKGLLLTNLYEYVEELDDYEEFMTHILLESIVKGTAIGFEDIEKVNRKYRNVEGIADEMKITERTETRTKLFGSIVPLEEFYPSSVKVRKIKDMPFCFWRNVVPYASFMDAWSGYSQSQYVQPKRSYSDEDEKPSYASNIDSSIPDGSVEVIRFYDKVNDQYVVLANGIWLNPIRMNGDAQEVSPLPWNHKELPFWEVKFDFFGDFFYGKSLPDRLKSLQDVLNVLTNMLLDQSFLTIFPPLLTNGSDSIEEDYLRPGRRISVDTQGLPLSQSYMALDMGTPGGWHQFILEYTRNILEEASVDKVSQGIAGGGDRTTAQEIRVAADGVSAMLQMFATMVNYGIKRKAYLKASNILQFGMNQEAPLLRQVMGEDSSQEAKDTLGIFMSDNAILTSGKRGKKVIEVYKDKASLPNRADMKARAEVAKSDANQEVEIVAITPEYIRNFLFDLKLVANPVSEHTQAVEKAMQLEKVQTYMTFFAGQIDVNELAAQTAEKMGDDPGKILSKDALGIAVQPEGGGAGMQGMNAANQLAGATGATQGPAEMAALTQ